MHINLKSTFLLSVAFLLTIGCKPEDQQEIKQKAATLTEFCATVADMELKSIVMPETGKFCWEKGDQVMVDNGSDVAIFTYNSSRGVFVTERDDFALAESYTAVFPASAYVEGSAAGSPKVAVAAEQTVYPDYVKDLTMVAKAGKDAEFVFQNLFSVVRIEFPADKLTSSNEGDIVKVDFTSESAAAAGIASVSDGTLAFENGAVKTISFDCSQNDINVEAPLFVAIPAQTYIGGFVFDFTFADNSTFTLSCKEDVTARANEVSLQRLLTPWAAFSGGTGTTEDPYILNSIADYNEFVEMCAKDPAYLAKSYKQTSDIDLGKSWAFQPVGSEEHPFSGTYDAEGHSLAGGVYRTDIGGEPTAMFRYTDGATIKNLKLTDWDLTSRAQFLAGVAGIATNTTFENCSVSGKFHQSVRAAFSSDSINNTDAGMAGGVAAFAENCTFSGCVFDAQLSATGRNVGGIAGWARNCSISKCSATGTSELHTPYHCAGSIIGVMTSNTTISECSAACSISSYAYCGGIVGYMQSGLVEKCVVSSSARVSTGKNYNAGGIAGAIQPRGDETASIDRCTVYADVTGRACVGGIAGYIDGNDTSGKVHITNCTYKGGTLSATGVFNNKYSLVGGLAGYITHSAEAIIENCMAAPKLILSGPEKTKASVGGVGGLFGFCNNTKITAMANCYTTVTLSEIQYRRKVVTTFSTYTLWGLAVGRNEKDVISSQSRNYYNSDNDGCGMQSGNKNANLEGISLAEMTDGTLLGKLNAGTSALQLGGEVTMAGWKAEANGYPVLDCVIADPQPRNNAAKKVSVIGDSISTFGGYIPAEFGHHYPCADGSVTHVEQTYWWQLIYDRMKNARLDANISYSGTRVTNHKGTDADSFTERYINLGGVGDPDIVLIHGGTNDWAAGCTMHPGGGSCKTETVSEEKLAEIFASADAATTRNEVEALSSTDFCSAYVKLICLIQQQYPDAKIVCIIGDAVSVGQQKSIMAIANHYGAKYVDLLSVNGFNDQTYMPKHDFDGTKEVCHPNAKAMTFIANKIYEDCGAWLEE